LLLNSTAAAVCSVGKFLVLKVTCWESSAWQIPEEAPAINKPLPTVWMLFVFTLLHCSNRPQILLANYKDGGCRKLSSEDMVHRNTRSQIKGSINFNGTQCPSRKLLMRLSLAWMGFGALPLNFTLSLPTLNLLFLFYSFFLFLISFLAFFIFDVFVCHFLSMQKSSIFCSDSVYFCIFAWEEIKIAFVKKL
jgi:hypothetical protein